jgi:hypothetical protein
VNYDCSTLPPLTLWEEWNLQPSLTVKIIREVVATVDVGTSDKLTDRRVGITALSMDMRRSLVVYPSHS